MYKVTDRTKQTIITNLKARAEENAIFLDGVDTEGSYGNYKTAKFVDAVGPDLALDLAAEILKEENFYGFKYAKSNLDEDAVVFKDFSGELSHKYGLIGRVYAKFWHWDRSIAIVDIHDDSIVD